MFIGFMGAGKSTAARARPLGVRAEDADRMLEARLGEPIEAYFDRAGEAAFREHEEALTTRLLDSADGGAIALGGGALQSERVRDALHRHTVVLLDVDLDTAWARAAGRGRPLARDRPRSRPASPSAPAPTRPRPTRSCPPASAASSGARCPPCSPRPRA